MLLKKLHWLDLYAYANTYETCKHAALDEYARTDDYRVATEKRSLRQLYARGTGF